MWDDFPSVKYVLASMICNNATQVASEWPQPQIQWPQCDLFREQFWAVFNLHNVPRKCMEPEIEHQKQHAIFLFC